MKVRLCLAACLLSSVGLVLIGSPAAAQEKKGEKEKKGKKQAKPEPVAKTGAFVYAKTPQGELKLLAHYPADWKANDKRSAIIFFAEGGAWTENKIDLFKTQADYLAKRGMVAFRAEYRVKNVHKTTADKAVEDAMSAVRWVRDNAPKLGVDPAKVAAAGGSSGGHLAMAAYTTPVKTIKKKTSHKPDLLVLYNPLISTHRLVSSFENFSIAQLMSPTSYIGNGLPPTAMFFGTNDPTLRQDFQQVQRFLEFRKINVDLYTADGQQHGFFNQDNWREATLKETDKFLVKNGYLKGKPTIKADARYSFYKRAFGGKKNTTGVPPGFDPNKKRVRPGTRPGGQPGVPPGFDPNRNRPGNRPGGRPGQPPGLPIPGEGVPPGVRPGGDTPPTPPLPPGANPNRKSPFPPGSPVRPGRP